MKYRNIHIALCACALLAMTAACSKHTTRVAGSAAYVSFETSCMGVEGDGSQTLRAWGKGERYAEYFNPFFADGGEYRKFVREESANEASRLEAKGSSINNYGVIVTVDREGLRRQLEADGVLKPGTRH